MAYQYTDEIPHGVVPTGQYEKRDAAFATWRTAQTNGPLRGDCWEQQARDAFNAGWAARKRAVDYALEN
jgi:hypothetical protein